MDFAYHNIHTLNAQVRYLFNVPPHLVRESGYPLPSGTQAADPVECMCRCPQKCRFVEHVTSTRFSTLNGPSLDTPFPPVGYLRWSQPVALEPFMHTHVGGLVVDDEAEGRVIKQK